MNKNALGGGARYPLLMLLTAMMTVLPAAGSDLRVQPLVMPGALACVRCDAEGLRSSIPNWRDRFHENVVTPVLDALPQEAAVAPPDSLPENMPLVTRLFWGRHGVVRAIGLAPEHRSGELRVRRRMLQWHQRMGFTTLAAFTAQMVAGVRLYNDAMSETPDAGAGLKRTHKLLGYTTFGLYSLTATLSLTAPPARRYGSGFSNVKLHRYLALIHFTGMMAQPWLGVAATNADTRASYDRLIRTHRAVGWVTYGAFTASILSIVLEF